LRAEQYSPVPLGEGAQPGVLLAFSLYAWTTDASTARAGYPFKYFSNHAFVLSHASLAASGWYEARSSQKNPWSAPG
jgi:hypothetical protein